MTSRLAVIAITLCILAAVSSGNGGAGITGIWNSEDNKAKIEIFRCGEKYCGRIIWLGQPEYPADDKGGMGGKPRVDRDNPVPELRRRPLLGLQIMEGFEYEGNDTWEKGSIYDPESGKTYRGRIRLVSSHRLDLRGYVGIPLFGRTTTWTR
jgi:uncharacterized protein (DUF2147 family)